VFKTQSEVEWSREKMARIVRVSLALVTKRNRKVASGDGIGEGTDEIGVTNGHDPKCAGT